MVNGIITNLYKAMPLRLRSVGANKSNFTMVFVGDISN